jgi:arginine decarboxylase
MGRTGFTQLQGTVIIVVEGKIYLYLDKGEGVRFMDQEATPLVSALVAYVEQGLVPFHTPGHKQGRAVPTPLASLWGTDLWRYDLTEVPGLDDLHAPQEAIKDAQILAAKAFGAEESFFLVDGSTAGIQAMILTVCNPGDVIIVPRNCHRSVVAGLILSGAIPKYLPPAIMTGFAVPLGITAAAVEQALRDCPEAKAVLMVSPTYHGICTELEAIAAVVHRHNKPLLVDQAHGAHLSFHRDLPPDAITCGADLVVHSTHKVLTSLTQTSLLHVQGKRIDRERLACMLRLVQSSSPSYLLMASLDACRRQLAVDGKRLLDRTLLVAKQLRQALTRLSGISILEAEDLPAPFTLDPTRFVIMIHGYSGPEAANLLRAQGVAVEMAEMTNLLFLLTVGDGPQEGERLLAAVHALPKMDNIKAPATKLPAKLPIPPLRYPPREAVFAPRESVPISQAVGKVAAEFIVPYPPGVPLVHPGEEITSEIINFVQELSAAGIHLQGLSDLEQIAVLQV